ncbi:MAG: UPF0182 family protein [Acidobacteriaceae bacterium]|nr:UPF0182 family protein [Acidobacteriaceae bacterium]
MRLRRLLLALFVVAVLFGGSILSYYVDALWFSTLGYGEVFWTTLTFEARLFLFFTAATFIVLFGVFLALKPARLADLTTPILVNGEPLKLPVESVLRTIAGTIALLIAAGVGLTMSSNWTTFALYWQRSAAPDGALDPIFERPVAFYLLTLPAWNALVDWVTTLAVIVMLLALFFFVMQSGTRLLTRRLSSPSALRGVSLASAFLLFTFAARAWLSRFDWITTDHTIFAGITYTDAHVMLPGMLLFSGMLALGGALCLVNAVAAPKLRWIVASLTPALVVFVGMSTVSWYVTSFIVKPNELVRERPFIEHNITLTRAAFALDRVTEVPFPADGDIDAKAAADNQETLQNIRLWDWRALQDTLRQIQEIRTYYDFPDIDIDRYELDGVKQQMMLAVRELNIERLPESSRNWINERLIYTHGYGVTMNQVTRFTPEGMPDLLLSNMPVESRHPDITVRRPEIYFGELTNGDVYVRTRQKEFNYPQGETNNVTTYEASTGIPVGGAFRRLVLALDRSDLARMPFSDDLTPDSQLLMRRNIRERVETLAPFLTFDADPYIVVTKDGHLVWMMDGYTTSDAYPYSRHYLLEHQRINYLRNSVKATIDAYDGSVHFYIFEPGDPIIAAYRGLFPSLFADRSAMPADLQAHVRYPELMLEVQAAAYGLYHMTSPDVFYNREDLWTVATEVASTTRRDQPPAAHAAEPNFVLMKLPGEPRAEFVQILPFTPANRNNLIGWIAGRSDGQNYGDALVYNFPKTRLVDGPLQIEARIDQNAQLSGQLSLWNQQGSHVRRGNLIVIPIERSLLYAQPIYLQAERSPMPELRIVVLAVQDRLAYGPNFETALAALLGQAPSSLATPVTSSATPQAAAPSSTSRPGADTSAPATSSDIDRLITQAAQDLDAYQRLTSEGRLGEAGQRLEALKQTLERLQQQQRR